MGLNTAEADKQNGLTGNVIVCLDLLTLCCQYQCQEAHFVQHSNGRSWIDLAADYLNPQPLPPIDSYRNIDKPFNYYHCVYL